MVTEIKMAKKLFLSMILLIAVICPSLSQVKIRFSGDIAKFTEELTAQLGPNLNPEQSAIRDSFFSKWDSSAFSQGNMVKIIDITGKLFARNIRISPHLIDFLKTLNDFCDIKRAPDYINSWLSGLAKFVLKPEISNEILDRYFRNTSSMIRDNIAFDSGSIKWQIKGNNIIFRYDTIFKMLVENVTLRCYSQRDSTEIYKVSGVYFPEISEFRGTKGMVTWEKAGYKKEDVFAEITNWLINFQRSGFSADSARLTHKTYFKVPVAGKLTDQASSYKNPEKAIFPTFETYTKSFRLENIYKGVNYEGGLTLEGASVRGTGVSYFPAKISLLRNDTLYILVSSMSFLFTKTGIYTQEAVARLFLDKDSIYHSNLGFSYNADTRQVGLFRTNNPISKSPYFDSYHNMDMYFDYLSWNMNESKAILSRARGASMGQARFESVSFFNSNYYERLMGIDNYHPLHRLKQFSEWYYSPTFPVSEFAKWLNMPVENVIGFCIDLANRGFLFYDRINNEITIKKKVDDYIASYSRKKDYDVINISSETNAPMDNAFLDLKNFRLTVNGVSSVFLSDSQMVAIYPYNRQLTIGKNRTLSFDGVVQAGLFTIFGHDFTFSYDTFKIGLHKIDSIRLAVETGKKDNMGNEIIKPIDNLIQLTTADLYIDDPKNKSGLKSYKQYPILNANAFSYIFFDRIPGLEGIYKPDDFYFKVDPFTYETIDHYKDEDMNLAGEFHGGNILDPVRQYLIIQEDNSLGFNMNIPDEGISIYGGKGRLYNSLSLSNKGLLGNGTLKRLTSSTNAEEYKFFPDSMITKATSFDIVRDEEGKFPDLKSKDVNIKWLPGIDEWQAKNTVGKKFEMFGNGTVLDGKLTLTPVSLKGTGTIDLTDSKIEASKFNFSSVKIQSDTSNYELKSLQGDGYAFIAENVNTSIDFNLQNSRFSLNTDSSLVKFPELQYICKMTNFSYDMKSRILSMEQRGKASKALMTAEQLLKLDLKNLDKPTFLSTNVIRDTISFSSWKGSYNLQEEYIEAENINYIHIADALIQPEKGKITINKRAKIKPLLNAIIAVNNSHILRSANIIIESSKRYSGSAIYDYIDANNGIQQIDLPSVTVDTATNAKGYIPAKQNFMLSPAFSFAGDVNLYAGARLLTFTGAAGLVPNCTNIKSYPVKFKAQINPAAVMIPLGDPARDINDNPVYSGSFLNMDSTFMYPGFLSQKKSWSDIQLVDAKGMLYFEKETGKYKIASLEKLADLTLPGEILTFDKNYCILNGEGKLNFGTNYDLLKMTSAGKVVHNLDSSRVNIEAVLAFDFHFSNEALKIMSDEIRLMPKLTAVKLNSEFITKAMNDLLGTAQASRIKEDVDLFGTAKNVPKEFNYKLLLNDVKLYWNEPTSSFRSKGKIGIGFIGTQPINVYVDGYVEIQRRRSGDLLDIYLKADESTWYYFSYFRGVMMTQSGNNSYNSLITSIKLNDRKHPESTIRIPYTYMIAVEDRLKKFLQRMTSDSGE